MDLLQKINTFYDKIIMFTKLLVHVMWVYKNKVDSMITLQVVLALIFLKQRSDLVQYFVCQR